MAISTIQPESCRVCGGDQRKVPKKSNKCRLLQLLDLTITALMHHESLLTCYIDSRLAYTKFCPFVYHTLSSLLMFTQGAKLNVFDGTIQFCHFGEVDSA